MYKYDYSSVNSGLKAGDRRIFASDGLDEDGEPIGEIQVSEYIIFLLAVDTYIRYLEEATSQEDPLDEVVAKGLRLLRNADSELDSISSFMQGHLASATHKRMLMKYLQIKATNPQGVGRRALGLRTILARGGAATMRGIFESNKALKQVREAMSASQMSDADAALDLLAKLTFRNTRLLGWVKLAASTAISGQLPANVVEAGAKEAQDQKSKLLEENIQQMAASGGDASKQAQEAQTTQLLKVQDDATAAARQSMDQAGELDEPLTKSQVVGIAVAAAAAATSDPSNPQNVPEALRGLDDEQRAAALTDGRVGVFAGAGAGKSSTLVARVAYLVRDRRVNPSRILVTSFNTKAASELKEKIGRSTSGDTLQQMSVGTLHSMGKRFVLEFGTPEEKSALESGFMQGGATIARAVQKVWEECYDKDPPPKLKNATMDRAKWSGNDITPEMAKAQAVSSEEMKSAMWYEMYEGLKGTAGPDWEPPCKGRAFESFMGRYRPRGDRLGDFTDQLKIFRDILKRNPAVKTKVQGMFDHIIVDEAQDRNTVMADMIDLMSQHITDGGDGKSCWIVGDDKQAINSFQGAKAALFKDLFQKEGWKTRVIRTNYRCEPEIVDAANRLIGHNEGNVPIPQVAAPGRKPGLGSIKVQVAEDEADAALSTIEEIKQAHVNGDDLTDNAVLCRTNKEIHSYETACIIRGIPYARKGAGSFLGSPETKAVLSYVQLATGSDFEKMQQSLAQVVDTPNRFFISDKKRIPEAVDQALAQYARAEGLSIKAVNPLEALEDRNFLRNLAVNLGRLTKSGKGTKFEEQLRDLADSVRDLRISASDPDYKTKDLFDDILSVEGVAYVKGSRQPQTFRESLKADLRDALGEDDEAVESDEDEEGSTKGLGNVAFLYKLAEPDPTDEDDAITPPTSPDGFAAKMSRYTAKMRDLRTDLGKWTKDQNALPPEQRKRPPGVYLGTVHSVKGAQWKTTFVQMPGGKFPMEIKPKPGEPPPDPVKEAERWEDERRLGYVALTRAAKNLRIVCPKEVGGRSAGISPFVREAGLVAGENISKPETPPLTKEAAELIDLYQLGGE